MPTFMDTETDGKPATCNDCVHCYITHDASFRYGCRALDFKSQRQPILDVMEVSGEPCHYFRRKERGLK
jgi:hypothetical protein